MQISHEDVVWKAGEIWYGDFAFPHRLYNAGTASRVHLVIDVAINDFVQSLFSPEFLAAKEKRLRVRQAVPETYRRLPDCPQSIAMVQVPSGGPDSFAARQ